MCNDYIGVMDSGVGGLSVLKRLVEVMPNQAFLYFGDNQNAPYGNKSKRELLRLVTSNIIYLLSYNVKAIVVACNTLSMGLMTEIKEFSPVPVFFVFPPFVKINKGEKALLISTPLTKQAYLSTYGNIKSLDIIAHQTLASQIEEGKIIDLSQLSGKIGKYKTVILGCTHYFFAKKEIYDHLKPLKIISGNEACVAKVLHFAKSTKSSGNSRRNTILFIGKNKIKNQNFWEKVVK